MPKHDIFEFLFIVNVSIFIPDISVESKLPIILNLYVIVIDKVLNLKKKKQF